MVRALPPEPMLTPTSSGLESMSWWKARMVSLVENQIGEVLLPPFFSLPSPKLLLMSTSFALKISEMIEVCKKAHVYSQGLFLNTEP